MTDVLILGNTTEEGVVYHNHSLNIVGHSTLEINLYGFITVYVDGVRQRVHPNDLEVVNYE